MSCNTPVVCIYENIGVNKEYINQYTGKLVYDKFLEDALLDMKENYMRYKPRKWLTKNISAEKTTELLRETIPNQSEIFVKINDPEVCYKDFPSISHSKYSQSLLQIFSVDKYDKNSAHQSIMELKSKFYAEIKSAQYTPPGI